MLWMAPDASKLVRLQGCFVYESEIERLAKYWKGLYAAQEAALPPSASSALPVQQPLWKEVAEAEKEEGDPLLDDAIALVRDQNRASVSLLQRKLRVGYARAARIMDMLEGRRIVGPPEGANYSRKVLPPEEDEGLEGREYEYEEDEE